MRSDGNSYDSGLSATVWAGDSAGENGEIAFIPPDMTSPYYAMIIEGAEPTAEAAGYKLNVQSPVNILHLMMNRYRFLKYDFKGCERQSVSVHTMHLLF